MLVQQRMLAPGQSAGTGVLHPWRSWTFTTETVATSESVLTGPSISRSTASFAVSEASCTSSISSTSTALSSKSLSSTIAIPAIHAAVTDTQTTFNTTSQPTSTSTSSLASNPFTNTQETLSASPTPIATSLSDPSITLYLTTIIVPPYQTPSPGIVQIQSDPATHGILAASIISSILVVLALGAMLGWWLIRRAREGYRYGLMKETRRPMF